MQQNDDPRKRPLLSAEQLRIMHRGPEKTKKDTPRGRVMKSPAAFLMVDLGVTKSHSRSYVSDDNSISESQFRTMK